MRSRAAGSNFWVCSVPFICPHQPGRGRRSCPRPSPQASPSSALCSAGTLGRGAHRPHPAVGFWQRNTPLQPRDLAEVSWSGVPLLAHLALQPPCALAVGGTGGSGHQLCASVLLLRCVPVLEGHNRGGTLSPLAPPLCGHSQPQMASFSRMPVFSVAWGDQISRPGQILGEGRVFSLALWEQRLPSWSRGGLRSRRPERGRSRHWPCLSFLPLLPPHRFTPSNETFFKGENSSPI